VTVLSCEIWSTPYFEVGTVTKVYRAIDNYTAMRLRIKHKVRRRKGGDYPLPQFCGYFGLVRLTALGHDVSWVKRDVLAESRMRKIGKSRSDERDVETEPG